MKTLFFLLLILANQFCFAQLKKEYQPVVNNFINLVKNNKKEAIANLISYPLRRAYPIPPIKNKQEFIKRYEEVFDGTLTDLIINSKASLDWSDVGWRGIMLKDGELWMDYDGRLTGINYQSKFEKELRHNLIETERKTLNPSIQNYVRPVHILETPKYRIRIDDLGNFNYRYSSWPIHKTMNEQPDLIINGGKFIPDGTGGNHKYKFKNGEYSYEVYIIVLGEEDSPDATLTVFKGDKEILSQNANITIK